MRTSSSPGPNRTGKTWLACAFGPRAARLGHSVLYLRMPRLFDDLAMARPDGLPAPHR
ncbi:ATP-binding protein [Bradyrhizobium sp. DASA03005]|uniref:ATP-binding protein n=1 Tax=Bradyrhizobium sp. SPXBL-02 TaxID=3395912 RepID=UPI003F6FA9E3